MINIVSKYGKVDDASCYDHDTTLKNNCYIQEVIIKLFCCLKTFNAVPTQSKLNMVDTFLSRRMYVQKRTPFLAYDYLYKL